LLKPDYFRDAVSNSHPEHRRHHSEFHLLPSFLLWLLRGCWLFSERPDLLPDGCCGGSAGRASPDATTGERSRSGSR
jgi:hypothetical protein